MLIQHAMHLIGEVCTLRHLSINTEKTYCHWLGRFGLFLKDKKLQALTPETVGKPDALMQLFAFCLCPAILVLCGAYTAPAHRTGTAVVLTILWTIVTTARFTWSATVNGFDDWLQTTKAALCVILGIASMLITAYFVNESEHESRLARSLIEQRKANFTG
jgi:hypothetical protein